MKATYWILTTAALAICAACNQPGSDNDADVNESKNEAAADGNEARFDGQKQEDAAFVYDVVASNYGEIKLAELANQKSRSDAVKENAQMIMQDHTLALNEAKVLAQAKAIEVPVEEKEAFHRKVENMAEESSEDFDNEWVKAMIDIHKKNIDRFKDRLEDTADPDLKAYISKTLPTLNKHFEGLKALRDHMDKS